MINPLKKHLEEIISIADDEFQVILNHFKIKKARKGDKLIETGETGPNVFFVISGLLKLKYIDRDGKEVIVSFAMENWWESDFLAFYIGGRATMCLQCIEDTEVYSLSLENYKRLCSHHSKMERFFLEKSTKGHMASQQRIISLITLKAQDRYDLLLSTYPTLVQRVSKSQLASYLGVSRETLSRFYA